MRLSKSNILHFSMDFVTLSLPKLHRLAYLTFFFEFILFLFPFLQEFSCKLSYRLQIALLNILIAFPLSSVVTLHSIASLACQCASSLTILPDEYEWTLFLRFVLLRPMAMTCFVWALDCRASSLSYLSLNCSYSDFLIDDFSGRSESHLLFPSQS